LYRVSEAFLFLKVIEERNKLNDFLDRMVPSNNQKLVSGVLQDFFWGGRGGEGGIQLSKIHHVKSGRIVKV
jgi:hypothetical protein